MKKLIIPGVAFVYVLFSTTLSGQVDFFPPGATWYYAFGPGWLNVAGYTEYAYVEDTVVAGRPAKKLNKTTYSYDLDDPGSPPDTYYGTFYMAQSGDSIFLDNGDSLSFAWKMDVDSGDLFVVEKFSWLPYEMNVVSVEEEVIHSLDVKKIHIEGGTEFGQWGEADIYDRFGPTNGFHYYTCWGAFDCYDPTLCRYKNDSVGEINFTGAVCNVLSTATIPVSDPEFALYPNPVSDVLTIHSEKPEDLVVRVFDASGRLVHVQEGSEVIDVSGWPVGIYILRGNDGDHSLFREKIIVARK